MSDGWRYIYRLSDGVFTGGRVRARLIGRMVPPKGCAFVAGDFDPTSQRVDVAALARAEPGDYSQQADFVVDYVPPVDKGRERREQANLSLIHI